MAPARQTSPAQQTYAEAEMFALALSWLSVWVTRSSTGRARPPWPVPKSTCCACTGWPPASGWRFRTWNCASTRPASPGNADGQRLEWSGPWLPRSTATPTRDAGPPLARPEAWSEAGPTERRRRWCSGPRCMARPGRLEARLAALAAAADLAVCEIGLGRTGSQR